MKLDDLVKSALGGDGVAFRMRGKLQPAAGLGGKVWPPTHKDGKYAEEKRRIDGTDVSVILLDSVQSQANRIELALLEACDRQEIEIPRLSITMGEYGRVTSLDAPHRASDAIFRDSLLEGRPFRETKLGQAYTLANSQRATAIFEICPNALIFGAWDSTVNRSTRAFKIARALSSELVAVNAKCGVRTSSRIDPLGIEKEAIQIYKSSNSQGWTLDSAQALIEKGKAVTAKPSEVNHGNIPPTIEEKNGGVTFDYAEQTVVLSLPQLRRFRFPLEGESTSNPERDLAARATLATLALYGCALQQREGYDLRSRCLLVPAEEFQWELLGSTLDASQPIHFTVDDARLALQTLIEEARSHGLKWGGAISLEPSADLRELVARSAKLVTPEA